MALGGETEREGRYIQGFMRCHESQLDSSVPLFFADTRHHSAIPTFLINKKIRRTIPYFPHHKQLSIKCNFTRINKIN